MPFVHPLRRMNGGGSIDEFDDDLPVLRKMGIQAVVSLLNTSSDSSVFESAGFSYIALPIPDGGAPTLGQANDYVRFASEQVAQERAIVVHCSAGIGRTGTMLGVYLISRGETPDDAFRLVRNAEGTAIETSRQREFLDIYARAIRAA